MASTSAILPPPLRPIIINHHQHPTTTRFLLSWTNNKNNVVQQKSWILNNTTHITKKDNVISHLRLPIFFGPRSHSTYSSRSLWSSVDISTTSLCSLLQSRVRHFRSSWSSMTTAQASAQDPPQSSSKTVRVVIKGRVQGVFYRNWTVENATHLGLKGWVRNKRDGSVEALFSGNADSVQEMEQRCRRGPPAAIVTGLDVFPSNEDPGTGFERKQTA